MRPRSGPAPSGRPGRRAGAYRLTGTKIWISNAPEAERYLVFATVDPDAGVARHHGVPRREGRRPGSGSGRTSGRWGSAPVRPRSWSSRAARSRPRTASAAEGDGYRIALSALGEGRISIAAACVGLARAGLEAAARYLGERQAFGGPLSDQQGLRFMLAEMARDVAAARALTREAAAAKDRGEPLAEVSSLAKWTASDTAMRVATDAVQLFGGERLLARDRRGTADARRQGRPDLRGHEPDPPRDRRGRSPQAGAGRVGTHRAP